MDELIKNIPFDEIQFINNNYDDAIYFYGKVLAIKNNDEKKVIRCKNSRQRKLVHIFAYLLNLYHASYRACEPDYSKSICLYGCPICNKKAGVGIYKIYGVTVSTKQIELRRIDYRHQKKFINLYNMDKLEKKIENDDVDNIPDWLIKNNFKKNKKI